MAAINLGRVVGKSAYEVWLDAGNTGTVADYLAAIKGDTGEVTTAAMNTAISAAVDPVTSQLADISKFRSNLFNAATVVDGYYASNDTGALSASADFATSDFIPVVAGQTYIVKKCRYCPIYNASKTRIAGKGETTLVSGYTFTAPAGAAYIRISWAVTSDNLAASAQQVNAGNTLLAYESYGYKLDFDKVPDKAIPAAKLTGQIGIDGVDFAARSKNLFDVSAATVGYFVNQTNGLLDEGSSHTVSDYIPVSPQTAYTFLLYSASSQRVAYYDANKAFISGALNPGKTFTTPVGCAYIRYSAIGMNAQQLEKGTVSTGYEPFGYAFTKSRPVKGLDFALPAKLFALVGQEFNVYFDNILNDRADKYDIDVTCTIGKQYKDFYRVTPADAGTYAITIKAYLDGVLLAVGISSIIVKAATVGNGVNRSVLVIGDSTTAGGTTVAKLLEDMSSDVMDVTLLGTKGTAPALQEGVSGWTSNNFRTRSDGNSFYNPGTAAFDFAYYMAQRGYTGVDYVVINLGINDMFSYTDDAALATQITAALADYDFFIASIHAYNAAIKIGIALTIPPNANQDAFGKAYACGQTRWRYKRNNFLWVKALIAKYDTREAESIYLVPINTNLDTRYNMGFETEAVNARNTGITLQVPISSSGVHPVEAGYWQIADVYWFWLKSFES